MEQKRKSIRFAVVICTIVICIVFLSSCGPSEIEFAVKHIQDRTGEQKTEVFSYEKYVELDNSAGEAPVQVQIELQQEYNNQIIERLTTDEISSDSVRNEIVELYKLSPNDPEGTIYTALCPLSVVIPAGAKAIITVEWTERWAEGVINQGVEGEGKRLGTYSVFLGYLEPCSLVMQENQ